jgi:TetR/AcrR family transcriptional regulator, mexJK operon transcriptional repressor
MADRARGKGRPNRADAPGIDRAIRDAAFRMMLDQDEPATLNAIAMAAGVSRKSLYARYPNKEELFLEVIGELLQNAPSLGNDASGSAETQLFHYIRAAFDAISRPESQAIHQLLTKNPVYIAALRSEMLAATQTIFVDPLRALLGEAKRNGTLVIDDENATANVVIRLIFAESMAAYREFGLWPTSTQQEDYSVFLANLVTRGLTPRAR